MKRVMNEKRLKNENEAHAATGGRSQENSSLGFRPAFFDVFVAEVCPGDTQKPVLSTQPMSQTINRGQTAMLLVAATTVTPSLAYQWYRGDSGFTSDPVAGEGVLAARGMERLSDSRRASRCRSGCA